jgi:hypothetical protein
MRSLWASPNELLRTHAVTADAAPNDLAEMPKSQQTTVLDMAAEARLPVEFVADAYRRELSELTRTARITQYLPVLASRRVRRRLRTLQRSRRSDIAGKSP